MHIQMWTFGFMKFFYGTSAKIAALHFIHTTHRNLDFAVCFPLLFDKHE